MATACAAVRDLLRRGPTPRFLPKCCEASASGARPQLCPGHPSQVRLQDERVSLVDLGHASAPRTSAFDVPDGDLTVLTRGCAQLAVRRERDGRDPPNAPVELAKLGPGGPVTPADGGIAA